MNSCTEHMESLYPGLRNPSDAAVNEDVINKFFNLPIFVHIDTPNRSNLTKITLENLKKVQKKNDFADFINLNQIVMKHSKINSRNYY